jgi:hypothetical protein
MLMSHMGASRTKMHQTTVRFGADLWTQLEHEAASTGVSAAQYVREATLSRLAYSAAQRGDGFGLGSPDETAGEAAAMARARATERQSDSSAVWAQARLARERARSVRKAARATQAAAPAPPRLSR